MTVEKYEFLNDDEFNVCRMSATERPYTGVLLNESRDGMYLCKCCKTELFSSDAKFDSHCGWPSFHSQSNENVGYKQDHSLGMQRIEIFCRHCNSHLGHVFNDGPEPTGRRYCVNSLSLFFKSDQSETLVRG